MEKPDTVVHYEEMLAAGDTIYLDPIELDDIFHWYAEDNQLDKVDEVLKLALRLHPDDLLVKQMDAEYSLNMGDAVTALEKLDKIFNPDQPYHCILRSAAFAKLGKKAEALEMAEQALQNEDPKDFVAYDLGLGFMNAAQYTSALHYFNRCLELHPDDVRTMSGILFCKVNQGKGLEMADLANRIIELDPFNYEAWLTKGNCLVHDKHYDEAIEAFDYAIAIAPEEPDPIVLKARCMDETGKKEEAIAMLREAAERAYEDQRAAICLILSTLLYEQKHQEEAVKAVWDAYSSGAKDTESLIRIGYAFRDVDDDEDAINIFEAANESAPGNMSILTPLAELYSNREMYTEAATMYKQMVEIEPSASLYALYGGTMMSLSKFAKAYKLLEKANELEVMWQTYVLMAACNVELRHPHMAEECLRLAYALNQDDTIRLFESLCPIDGDKLKKQGFFDKLEAAHARYVRKREAELRLLAEKQQQSTATLPDNLDELLANSPEISTLKDLLDGVEDDDDDDSHPKKK